MSLPDYYDLFKAHDREQAKELERLPVCEECGEVIQSDICYEINDCYICESCLKENHRKWVDDLI